MITKISINNIATYKTYIELNDLKKINFIFGANGSGKTTISRILDQASNYPNCLLHWLGGIPIKILVYNKDFVERNFNQENTVKGVFTLGDDQVESERQIALLRPQIDNTSTEIQRLNVQLNGKISEKSALEPIIQEKCWKKKQKYDLFFEEAFTGFRNSAEKFKDKVLFEAQNNKLSVLSLDELKEKAQTIYSKDIKKYETIPTFDASNLIQIESNEILKKIIIGDQDIDIAKLIKTLENIDWVRQGRKHFEKSSPICPFCQQTTQKDFSNKLNNFFSETYSQEVKEIEQLVSLYTEYSANILDVINTIFNQNPPFLKVELFQAENLILQERITLNKGLLQKKLSEPSLKIFLEPLNPIISKILNFIQDANTDIKQHNLIVQNLASEKQDLTGKVWKYIANELEIDLKDYLQNKSLLEKAINGMSNSLEQKKIKLNQLESQIKEYENKSTSILPTVNEINNLLLSFGFTSFRIEAMDEQGHYKICRLNGDDASRSMSEGEKTFITFLYFYSLIKGSHSASGIIENRIVVFDDPISSLDSDILYIVSSLIKGVFDDIRSPNSLIKQVFILTHNVYFHKEITFNQKRERSATLSEESFWMVKKNLNGSIVEKCMENPIRSAYELLWSDIKTSNQSSLTIQNTLRRILENYFTMWGGKSKDEICNLFENNDKLICQSLFSWVNDGSHSIHDDLYINHGQQTNDAYLRVFKEIFYKAGQDGHYEMMTR